MSAPIVSVPVPPPLTVRVADAVALAAFESVTFTVKLNEPVALGVPLMTPPVEFSARPEGKAPNEMLK